MIKYPLAIALILLPTIIFCQETHDPEQKYKTLSSEINKILKETKAVGISVAIIDNYKIAWAAGFGLNEVNTGDSVTTQTLFQAASITKSITAVTVMRGLQEGKLSLDEDVNKYLKTWKIPDNEFTKNSPITLRQLLGHMAGISNAVFPVYEVGEQIPTALQALQGVSPAKNKQLSVTSSPGKIYSYSSAGYAIIQQVLTDTEERTFEEIVNDKIFSPLQMSHSTFNNYLSNDKFKSFASGHLKGNEVIKGKYYIMQPLSFGSLWTTPTDLAKFLIEMQHSLRKESNNILDQEKATLMLEPISKNARPGYRLGFMIERRGTGVNFFGHDGHNYGYIASMLASLEGGFGLVIMTNSENGWKAVNKIKKLVGRKYWGF